MAATRPGGPENVGTSTIHARQVWDRIPDEVRERIVDLALDAPDTDAGSEPTRRAWNDPAALRQETRPDVLASLVG
jgi:hypothetical protein